MNHDVKHVISLQELLTVLVDEGQLRPPRMGINDLKVRISTGPGKHQTHLIGSVYYSPETQSIIISTEE